MSDEEAEYSEYEEEEVEEVEERRESVVEPTPKVESPKKPPSVGRERLETVTDESSLNEAEKAMIAAKKRQENDDAAKLQDYEERRRVEREREEEELKALKEKQEQRRIQREEEDRAEEERRKEEEEKRRNEESERRARAEEEKRKKMEAAEKKRQQMLNLTSGAPGGRNFILPEKKKDQSDKFGNIVQAKHEMGLTKDQRETAKATFMTQIEKQLGDMGSMSGGDLRTRIKEMHQRICKLETEKYDLEKRVQSQEYDLKELNERQRQFNRKKDLRRGVTGASDDTGGRFPAKIAIISKYDRQIDRRNFSERRALFDKKNAFPCFPNIGPPPTILDFRLKPEGSFDQGYNEEDEEDEE